MKELETRRIRKKKKPHFIRQDAHKKKRLGNKWRKPKGLHSKMRLGFKGHPRKISSGYGSPKLVEGADRTGLMPKIICNRQDLEGLKEKEGAVISGSVGKKKKLEMLNLAIEKDIAVINIKDIKKEVEDIQENIKKRAEKKKALTEKKKEKEKELKKKSKAKEDKKGEEKEGLAGKLESEEDKQQKEKKEKDKLLTKKDMK